MIVLSKQELEALEKDEYQRLKQNIDSEQHKYCLGRWGMVLELLDKLEDKHGN